MKNVQGINGGAYREIVPGPKGVKISDFRGTPLYALAKNANVGGGNTLSRIEMVFFLQQMKEMGFNPEKYGLEIVPEDLEGANAKETEKNVKDLNNSVKKSYEGQFGKKNNAVQTAQDAETRAYSNIKVAKDAFARNHKGIEFTPENLGARPNFMDPMYKDNLTKYVSDLNAWAQDVAHTYQDADSMSNEQLAMMIMANDDINTAEVTQNDNENTAILMQQMEEGFAALEQDIADGKAEIINQIKTSEGNIKQQIRNSVGQVITVIRNAEGHIIGAVNANGEEIKRTVRTVGKVLYKQESRHYDKTRDAIKNAKDEIMDEVDDEAINTREQVRRTGERNREEMRKQADRVIDNF